MTRRAWRVSYEIHTQVGTLSKGATVCYYQDKASAMSYAISLFKNDEGGSIKVEELDSFDVGVPGDVELAEILRDDERRADAEQLERMRSPGNVHNA